MQLPEADRAKLVHELLCSLSPMADDDSSLVEDPLGPEPALTVELQQRRRAYLAGETGWGSIEELETDLANVLAATRR